MSYPKKTLKVRPTKGLVTDIDPSEVGPDFWTGGSNVQFRDSFAMRTKGYTAIYDDIQDDIRHILNVSGSVNYWLYVGKDSVYVVETTNHTDISPTITSVSTPNQWSSGVLNGVPFFCNGIDEPFYWGLNTASACANVPNWPTGAVANSVRAHRYNLFALGWADGTGDYPMQVRWSNSAEPGTIPTSWVAAATNDAGSASLSETPGKIIDGLPLRSSLLIYKQHSAYSADYIGGQYTYEFRKLFITAGILNRNCACDVDGFHYLLTDGDVVMTDGNQVRSLVDLKMRNFLFNQLDQTNFESAFVVKYASQNEVWICFPSSGNTFCDLALVIDTTTGNPIGVRDLPSIAHAAVGVIDTTSTSQAWDDQSYTWDAATESWNKQTYNEANDSLVMAYSDDSTPTSSKLFQVDAGTDFDGTAIESYIAKHMMSFDDPDRVKFIRRVMLHVVAVDGTEIICRVGASMTPDGTTTWTAEQTYTVGTSDHIDVLLQGRYISFEARSVGGTGWTITGFDIEAELRGYF